MTISAENLFTWPVGLWLVIGGSIVTLIWLATMRVHIIWQRVFFRTAIIALCFTPLPTLEMFTEAAMAGTIVIVPLWYVLFWSIIHGNTFVFGVSFVIWLVVSYFLWVAGMSIHQFVVRPQHTTRS